MKMFLISDNVDTYTGMRLAGVDGVVVHERDELRTALEDVLTDKSVGIVLLTEKFGREFPDIIDTFRLERKMPLLVEIPDRHGTGRQKDFITSYITEAIGLSFNICYYIKKEGFLLTLEEKIAHLQSTSMEQARAEGNAIIDSHREALEKVFEDHKAEALRQAETRIKAETTNARLSLNQAAAKSQLEIKRRQGKVQQELKDKIFDEANSLVQDYMKTEDYNDFLVRCIRQAVRFAGEDPVIIYINPSDEKKRSDLEDATRVHLTISAEDFIGGVRAVIRSRNILIDNSFKTQLRNEYDKFMFLGGDGIA